jgi:hypothetical protein
MHEPKRGRTRRILVAVVLTAATWIPPPRASAQLLGSLIVTIASPGSGSTVSGTIPVNANVSVIGALTVRGVQFKLDGGNLGAEDTSAPYSLPWDTRTASNATHTLTAVARDALGITWTSDPVTVTVFNDKTPPTVAIISPSSGEVVRGTLAVSASASDDVGVTSVEFRVEGAVIGQDTTTPYGAAWDTTTVTDGSYRLTARAQDAAGNASTSAGVTVTVSNDVTRIEETSAAVTYTGAWNPGNTDRAWSGGTAALSSEALARATLRFTGTGVSWIGFRGPGAGIARIVLDGTPVATVDGFAPSEEVQAMLFTASGLGTAEHTLAIEVTGGKNANATGRSIAVDAFEVRSRGVGPGETFAPGDVVVSLETGPVQWWHPDGTLHRVLGGAIPGTGEGTAFDGAGNLYVTRWCTDPTCSSTGNTVEMFDVHGQPRGPFGSGYDCNPHAIVFDAAGVAYVGQAGCTGAILKLVPGQPAIELAAAPENQGSFWIDVAADGCTILYTSWGRNVKRFDGCARAQLPDFNVAPLPSAASMDLRVLPDGGALVSSGDVIARLDASGAVVRTYEAPGASFWAGLALVGDGTFWAGSYESSAVYRFDLATGAVLSSFQTGTPAHTVVGVSVKR